MGLWIILVLQIAATGLGFVVLWRRQRSLGDEVVRLREALSAVEHERAVPRQRARVGQGSVVTPVDAEIVTIETSAARAARAWSLPNTPLQFGATEVQPDTLRGLILGAVAGAPALGFFLSVSTPLIVAAGLLVSLAMTLLGLRYEWRASAWAGVVTGAGWALLGFVLGAAQAAPVIYSALAAFCGVAGLVHAHLRRATPGAVTALSMATLVLALASQIGIIGPAGAAFGVIVAAAAIIGAISLRLEALHLAGFGAALIGLFVLSGQDAAAIWFTPATSWAGALFLAIALVRVPHLGARGVALAGTGALAPLLAIGALHFANHGLADRFAAAGSFAVLSAALGGLIALAAIRRPGGLAALKVTLWVLAIGAFAAISAAIILALPSPLAAPAFAALALSLTVLNARVPDAAWRAFTCIAAVCAAANTFDAARLLLEEAPAWAPSVLVAAGIALPALLAAVGALFAGRAGATFTAGLLEIIAFTLFISAANLMVRLFFSDGATLLASIGFVETGMHIATWLAASLLIAVRSRRGAGTARMGAATAFGLAGLGAAAFAGVLWLTP